VSSENTNTFKGSRSLPDNLQRIFGGSFEPAGAARIRQLEAERQKLTADAAKLTAVSSIQLISYNARLFDLSIDKDREDYEAFMKGLWVRIAQGIVKVIVEERKLIESLSKVVVYMEWETYELISKYSNGPKVVIGKDEA
jgi:succinylglutamate desuccinylase